MIRLISKTVIAALVAAQLSAAQAAPPTREGIAFFETKIRPILAKHCYECHAEDAAEVGGKLRLDSMHGMRRGGQSGLPAVVAGKPDESLIVQALKYEGLEMPPDAPLPESVVNDFVKWIEMGAPDPRNESAQPQNEKKDTVETDLWSLKPILDPPLPEVKDRSWPRDPIDRFILARIEAEGLKPAADAPPERLIRRLYFDLIGLPPTFEQIEAFKADYRQHGQAAVERVVDDLLARPQFGERWGRHWLDVARYGESNGNDGLGRNPTFPHAWRYRDYVINAFNEDTPYDRFITEQIAGDLLPYDTPEQYDRQVIATGLLAMGSKPAKAMNANFDMDVVADQIDVIGRGFLGLSVACARCHDHKFDPIPTRDYYALAGIFMSSDTMWGLAANEGLTAPKTDLHVLKAARYIPPPPGFVETVLVLNSNTGQPRPVPKPPWPEGTPLAMGLRDKKKPVNTKININGESNKLGAEVPRGFLSVVSLSSPIEVDPQQSGRLQLAQWLTHPDHPLTARVMVNRLWLYLFGDGIVRTPDDFGEYGERPTHPELLDHLAVRFRRSGWSIKQMIRQIVLSRTYQFDSHADPALFEADALNLLHARHNRRRLEAEALRDAMLQASGQLNLQPREGSLIGHRDILVNRAGNLHEPSSHRSVYLCYLRHSPPPELAAFNLPEFTSVVSRRDESTVPAHALHLFNNPFVVDQSAAFAQQVMASGSDAQHRVTVAWKRALGREPRAEEVTAAVQLVDEVKSQVSSEEKAWAALCQALLMANEFRYVD